MTIAIATQLISWLLAGSIAAWFKTETSGVGPLGVAADWVAGTTGAFLTILLAPPFAWLASLVFQGSSPQSLNWLRNIEEFSWWYSVPLAFLGGLLLSSIYRVIFRVRARPSP
jgi:uncharacterized membrane protein YeaQ/YmgE (transglycosylase-associated protein family)